MTMKRPSTTIITSVPLCPLPRAKAPITCVMPRPKMKRIFASKICRTELTPERSAMVRNHPAPRRMRRMMGMLGSIAAGGADVLTGVPPGLSDMLAPCIAGGMLQHGMLYCYAKPIVQSRRILHRAADIVLPPALSGYDSERPGGFPLPGWVVRREACSKTFIIGGVTTCHAGTRSAGFSVPPCDFFAGNHALLLVR